MIRRTPRATRTEHTLSLHDALPIFCDRFLASSLVFQSLNSDGTRNLDNAVILQSHAMFCFDLKPHLSIYLDAPTNVRLARISGRAGADLDRFEEYGNAFETASSEKFRSEEHTSELQSLMRISYAVFCLKKKNNT